MRLGAASRGGGPEMIQGRQPRAWTWEGARDRASRSRDSSSIWSHRPFPLFLSASNVIPVARGAHNSTATGTRQGVVLDAEKTRPGGRGVSRGTYTMQQVAAAQSRKKRSNEGLRESRRGEERREGKEGNEQRRDPGLKYAVALGWWVG